MGNVFVDLQGLEDNHDFVADCCRYSENILSEEANDYSERKSCGGASSCRSW